MRAKLKVGLIVDDTICTKYVYELGKWGQNNDKIDISHLLVQKKAGKGSLTSRIIYSFYNKGFLYLSSQISFAILRKFEQFILKKSRIHKDHSAKFDLSSTVKNIIPITPIISPSGLVSRFSEDDIERIKALELDVLIRCGSGILRGQILTATKFGIISFHHADNRINRGWPAGFWEVYLKQPSTGFTIQRLTEELDGGDVFMRGHIATKFFHLFNEAELYKKSNFHLQHFLEKVAESGELPSPLPPVPYSKKLYKRPSAWEICCYVSTLCLRIISKLMKKALGYHCRWGVAFCRSDWMNLVMWRGIKIPNPPSAFLADPFVFTYKDKDYCFLEEYDYKTSLGHISVYQLHKDSAERIGIVLKEPFHLSFPYIFEYNNNIYMCPETSANKDIRIYKCLEFPDKWELDTILMTNVSAVDTMLFEKDGRWWMMTNIDPSNIGNNCTELFIFSSDSPLSRNWLPHSCNPIIVDARVARNGGLLRNEGALYRVSQSQSFDQYGASCKIHKILTLDQEEYKEEVISDITADFFEDLIATHHLHSNSRVTVFDFASWSKLT